MLDGITTRHRSIRLHRDPDPDALLLNAETCTARSAKPRPLGEPCREIIELRYYGDLSYEEIARELRLNPKTVARV